jgi:hypothetical protein
MMKTTKQCELCGETKPLSDFSKSYRNRCRTCVAEQTRTKRLLTGTASKVITADSSQTDIVDTAEFRLVEVALPALINCIDGDFLGRECDEIAEKAVRIARAALSQMRKSDNNLA